MIGITSKLALSKFPLGSNLFNSGSSELLLVNVFNYYMSYYVAGVPH